MDEVGRGTTPVDGLAIAYACLHHLYTVNRSRALFATHFHQLAVMAEGFKNVGCYCTDIEEAVDGTFSYIHKLRRGVNTQSHALKVARLAGKNKLQYYFLWVVLLIRPLALADNHPGIPESTIQVAEETLVQLQEQAAGDTGMVGNVG